MLAGPPGASAQQGAAGFDPYLVRGLAVSATAADAVAAKEIAIGEALRSGAARVIRRVAAGPGAGRAAEIDGKAAEAIAATIEIDRETIGRTGYAASVTVAYSPMLVRGYLARRGVGVVDTAAPPVLLVPLVVEDGLKAWWEDAADWAGALAAANMEDGLTPVRLPRNTRQDRQINADRLFAGDRVTLQELRIRYRTHGTVVARLDRAADSAAMLVGLSGEDAAGPVEVTVEVPEGGLPAAAAKVSEILSARWKAVAAGTAGQGAQIGSSLPVRVLFAGGSGGWDALRRRLERSGAVNGLAVESMEAAAANVVVWHSGGVEDLPDRLARDGLDLFRAGSVWILQAY